MSSFCETRIKYSVASSNPAKIDVRISGSMKPAGTYKTNLEFPGGILSVGTYETHLGITKNIKPSIDKKRGPCFQVIDHSEGNFRASIPPNKRGVLSLKLNWKSQRLDSL